MPYNNAQSPMNLPMGGMEMPKLSEEDVIRLREQLKQAGLDGSFLDRANEWRGGLLAQRDAAKGQLASSLGLGNMTKGGLAASL